ncbi:MULTISPECIES: DUF2019 domain-containing protein [Roseobacteraceae]|uniref:Uncharacterized protein n=1 Tax=Pseudosulfitobacter pseudonitzschiae TaxID=1402135 RepID=A0A221JW60_9RHOB|nr:MULTISPECIES: DUF2019 domain-containing protein [Roseobacteraceae]ASM70975.1 hypothetical protein SULPSESMR1_00136 [Pseudosulfitobacter pseudonitzschiae]
MSMNNLVDSYRANAELHGKFSLVGDARKTNHAYDELLKILKALISTRTDRLLFSLYEDNDLFVQLWAAAHTLELEERRAIDKLQEIAELELDAPLVSMCARYTIKGWNEGELRVRRSDQ